MVTSGFLPHDHRLVPVLQHPVCLEPSQRQIVHCVEHNNPPIDFCQCYDDQECVCVCVCVCVYNCANQRGLFSTRPLLSLYCCCMLQAPPGQQPGDLTAPDLTASTQSISLTSLCLSCTRVRHALSNTPTVCASISRLLVDLDPWAGSLAVLGLPTSMTVCSVMAVLGQT